jgi:DNA-binding response OmpR family regulator
LIDDDERLGEMLAAYLGRHNIELTAVLDGETGLSKIESETFDVVLLDIMLPGLDGMEVCRRLRAMSRVPVIMLTARGETSDRIVGLELGADDYVPKPFDSRELVARINAVVRRARPVTGSPIQPLRFDDLVIDPESRRVSRGGRTCELTGFQFDLLHYLASRAGRVLTRDQLLDGTRERELEAFDRSIDVHISRIRAAIEDDPRSPRFVLTVRGVGYQFAKLADGERS